MCALALSSGDMFLAGVFLRALPKGLNQQIMLFYMHSTASCHWWIVIHQYEQFPFVFPKFTGINWSSAKLKANSYLFYLPLSSWNSKRACTNAPCFLVRVSKRADREAKRNTRKLPVVWATRGNFSRALSSGDMLFVGEFLWALPKGLLIHIIKK